ncbi:type II toxin-antitoxin system PemK/MazF family toxin [Cupriavidus agavae]|uniref:Uncharacterized protein YifN (PemK superfamily) n=1 Tax=Cupriavidus agavae TaxID=1001822 RepID=A0A4Q7RBS1_9BURK|nr:type II toxin-antitoxin system PemK/MazF family toxin [Cupriavidus agavae]RZT29598.1 uncharacterized protein YifN (PemK superfamily) [Cupriavidus agavae]
MKVGQLMECDFGNYRPDDEGRFHVDGHIPPEMVKKRMVVVMNAKLGNGCLVVPVSSTRDAGKIDRGLHVEIDCSLVTRTAFYDSRQRWAKADLVQQVSKDRVSTIKGFHGRFVQDFLPRALVTDIQTAVLKSVNGIALISENRGKKAVCCRSEQAGSGDDLESVIQALPCPD